ncbi:MAG: MFS transporter [Promethearchaeota archaeon]
MSEKSTNNNNNNNHPQRTILGVSVQVFIMGLVSLFTDISSEMIQSILPLFIFSIGGTALILGLISGVTTALSNILKGITGWMSDKVNKRKPFVVAGYAISNLSKPFIGLSPSWEFVLALKSTDRIGKGLRTSSRDALISYYAIERGRSFGFHRAMDTLGAVIGSLLAFIFLLLLWSYSQIIFFSIIPGICAIILILSVKDVDPNQFDETKLRFHGIPKVDKISKNFLKLILILGVIEFASLDIAFLIIRAADYVSLDLIFLIPLFYLLSNIVYTCLSPVNGILSDRIGRKPVILIGLSILLITSIMLACPVNPSLSSLILIIIIFLLYGFYMSAVDPISRAYIADLAGKNKRGRAYGYYYLSVGLISMTESLIFGLIYDQFSYTWAFIYASILLFISMIIFGMTDFSKITKQSEIS